MAGVLDQVTRYLVEGGFVMKPLALATLVLWYALGYRLLVLRRGTRRPVQRILEVHRRGGARPRGVVDGAVALGLRLLQRRPHNPGRVLDDAFFDLRQDLGRYALLVQAIVIVAPLAGLLGTVAGMIETFDSLGDMTLFSQSGGIAGGVSQALISTQMGLAVAIPGLLVGHLLARRQRRLEHELEEVKQVLCQEAAA